MIRNLLMSRFSETVLEVLGAEAGGFEVGEIVCDEFAEDALRRGLLDGAHRRIERRDVARHRGEGVIDERVDACGDAAFELRYSRGQAQEIVLAQPAIKLLDKTLI